VDDHTLRLNCLKIARPDGVMNPDAKQIIDRANAFYQFVMQATEEGSRQGYGPCNPTSSVNASIADKPEGPAQSLSAGRRPRQGK
jgi:hypothetical protein